MEARNSLFSVVLMTLQCHMCTWSKDLRIHSHVNERLWYRESEGPAHITPVGARSTSLPPVSMWTPPQLCIRSHSPLDFDSMSTASTFKITDTLWSWLQITRRRQLYLSRSWWCQPLQPSPLSAFNALSDGFCNRKATKSRKGRLKEKRKERENSVPIRSARILLPLGLDSVDAKIPAQLGKTSR